MKQSLLSVLIASIPSRMDKMVKLYKKLEKQAKGFSVEILCLMDNKHRSIGMKRDALVQLATGKYLVFIDDDDKIMDNYIDQLAYQLENFSGDVMCFQIVATINGGNEFIVDISPEFENEEAHIVDKKWVSIKRRPTINSVWRSELAKSERFADASYAEDFHWSERLIPKVKEFQIIPFPLSYYHYHSEVTEAELTYPKGF